MNDSGYVGGKSPHRFDRSHNELKILSLNARSLLPKIESLLGAIVLRKEVRLLVGLSGWGGGWSWGDQTWTGLEVGVGLNSKGEGLW